MTIAAQKKVFCDAIKTKNFIDKKNNGVYTLFVI